MLTSVLGKVTCLLNKVFWKLLLSKGFVDTSALVALPVFIFNSYVPSNAGWSNNTKSPNFRFDNEGELVPEITVPPSGVNV